ncbi:MAG: hypothetical protein GC131_03715 [Alphaproteobacteria bacterium]|nr:hypothetical protein [Alphaproteobacteria bacterium]
MDLHAIHEWTEQALSQQVLLLTSGAPGQFAALLGLCLFYGIFHALGPGHGKSIVTSYFLGHKAHWLDGISAGFIFALGHSMSAILFVVVLHLILQMSDMEIMAQTRIGGTVGYSLIICIGFWMLWKAFRRSDDGHDHCHHGHDHTHHGTLRRKDAWALFLSASLSPCTGTMIVLLFTMANGILWMGILGALAIALGMWGTIAGIGIAAILLRHRLAEGGGHRRAMVRRALSITAGLVIIASGGFLLSLTLSGGH